MLIVMLKIYDWLNDYSLIKPKFAIKKNYILCGDFTPFIGKVFKCQTISFHYFSPRIPNL